MRRWPWITIGFVLSAATSAGAGQLPDGPVAQMPTVECVYSFLKSQADVHSVETYRVDGLRSAVGYTFQTIDGKLVGSAIMITGISLGGRLTYDGIPQKNDSQKTIGLEMDFLASISNKLESKCRITSVFDDLAPLPPSRQHWQREDLPN